MNLLNIFTFEIIYFPNVIFGRKTIVKCFNCSAGRVDKASASGAVDGFDSKSGETNDLKIGIHSFHS